MAIENRLDLEQVARALQAAIAKFVPGSGNVNVSNIEMPKASGLSAETILFSANWESNGAEVNKNLVARIQPSGVGLFMDYDLELEFQVISALFKTTCPVPEALFVETGENELGAPFMVMEKIEGQIASDDPPFTVEGWVLELNEGQQAKLAENSLAALASLHDLNIDDLGLREIGRGDKSLQGLDRTLEYWERFSNWSSDGQNPLLNAAVDWLKENHPKETGPDVLSWGDARLGNMIIGAEQSVSAIIDWEMVSIGPREVDVAWWLFLLEHHSSGVGVALPAGFPDLDAEQARYEELTGYSLQNMKYFKVFAGVRMCALVSQAAKLLKLAGFIPEDSPMALVNPATKILAALLDLPEPTGDSDYYIGQRE